MASDLSWEAVGERVRETRIAARRTQADLARALRLDRSAIARIESGARQVTALELFALADLLDVPVAHFVSTPPSAVVSHRQGITEDADDVTRRRFRLDVALESHARDVEWLHAEGFLPVEGLGASISAEVRTEEDARELADEVRVRSGAGLEPLGPLAAVCAGFGLHVRVDPEQEAGASLVLEPGLSAAVVGGAAEPGRRRATAAHELGHVLLRDEYTSDIGVAASRDEREQVVDAFAAQLLLPRAAIERTGGSLSWEALVRLAGEYRVSWGVAVRAARSAGAIAGDEAKRFGARLPRRGDFLEVLGAVPEPDLVFGSSPQWTRAALAAYRAGAVSARRVVELLQGAVPEDELPLRGGPEDAG